MPGSFAFTVSTAERRMSAARSSYAASNVRPVPPVTSTAPILLRSSAPVLPGLPASVMAVTRAMPTVLCPHKYHYDGRFADRKYREQLSSSRSGVNMTKKQLRDIDKVVSPLLFQGQSPYQILVEHPEPGLSVRTMYEYKAPSHSCGRNGYCQVPERLRQMHSDLLFPRRKALFSLSPQPPYQERCTGCF